LHYAFFYNLCHCTVGFIDCEEVFIVGVLFWCAIEDEFDVGTACSACMDVQICCCCVDVGVYYLHVILGKIGIGGLLLAILGLFVLDNLWWVGDLHEGVRRIHLPK